MVVRLCVLCASVNSVFDHFPQAALPMVLRDYNKPSRQ
jgi:hypothetical protein